MRNLAVVLAIVVGVVSCSKIFGGNKERKLCEHVGTLCNADFTSKDVDECSTDLPKVKDSLGDKYDTFLDCGTESATCMRFMGCFAGMALTLTEKQAAELAKGFSKMRR